MRFYVLNTSKSVSPGFSRFQPGETYFSRPVSTAAETGFCRPFGRNFQPCRQECARYGLAPVKLLFTSFIFISFIRLGFLSLLGQLFTTFFKLR